MSFDEIVDAYIREYREDARAEMQFFAVPKSPSTAIYAAALSLRADGLRLDHQRRIPLRVLEEAEARLQRISKKLAKAHNFDTLHQIVISEIGGIRGVGDLLAYDISHRIGVYFGKHPERVYLHAGTKIGARALGITGDSFDPAILPETFSRLTPAEIEDTLCLFKDELAGKKSKRKSMQGCAVPKKRGHRARRCC